MIWNWVIIWDRFSVIKVINFAISSNGMRISKNKTITKLWLQLHFLLWILMIPEQKLIPPPTVICPADIGRDNLHLVLRIQILGLHWSFLTDSNTLKSVIEASNELSFGVVMNRSCWMWPISMCFSLLPPYGNFLASEIWFFIPSSANCAPQLARKGFESCSSLKPIFACCINHLVIISHPVLCVNGDIFPQSTFRQIPPGAGKGFPYIGKNLR